MKSDRTGEQWLVHPESMQYGSWVYTVAHTSSSLGSRDLRLVFGSRVIVSSSQFPDQFSERFTSSSSAYMEVYDSNHLGNNFPEVFPVQLKHFQSQWIPLLTRQCLHWQTSPSWMSSWPASLSTTQEPCELRHHLQTSSLWLHSLLATHILGSCICPCSWKQGPSGI